MKPRPPLPDGPFLVLGLARSGQAAASALRAAGHEVIGVDSGAPETGRLRAAGVEIHTDAVGADLLPRVRALVKSPGVPNEAPAVAAARARGIPVLGELELAWRLLAGHEFLAVTGTNGKTTTTELLGAIHREAGVAHAVAGNVGTAAASLVGSVADGAVVLCECSSFQLEDALEFAPEAAVLLNLAPDHLDRHGTFEAYVAAKLRIFARQGNDDVAVVPDDLGVDDIGGCAKRVLFGTSPEAALQDRAGWLWWQDEHLIEAGEISLRGAHNRANAMAAAAVALARGIPRDAVTAALATFAGVAHRLEEVPTDDGITWVNDSKATNVASAVVALESFPGRVHLIAGGRAKGEDFSPLAAAAAARCAGVYLIGEAAGELRDALASDALPVHLCGDLDAAVARARAAASAGDVVLLSPACASYDQFRDYEERGDAFRALAVGP